MGPEVAELEAQLAEYVGTEYALACSSGTDALVLPLMHKKLTSSDAIFTTPFTFFASAEAITLAGATPVFVDIDPATYNMDPAALEQAIQRTIDDGALTPRGVIPVDLFGLAADYNRINAIAEKFSLFVLEDAAQAFGAPYFGQRAGALAETAATSFYPAKPLGCYGDGGAVFTNDADIYQELVSLRVHGQATSGDKYDNVRIGLNARMDTIQAAILLEKLKLYDAELAERNRVAESYTDKLRDVVITPELPPDQGSVWAQYSIQVEDRDAVRAALQENGIPTAVFYPIPVHLSTAYSHLQYRKGDFPIAERISERIFSLPMHPFLAEDRILEITETIKRAV